MRLLSIVKARRYKGKVSGIRGLDGRRYVGGEKNTTCIYKLDANIPSLPITKLIKATRRLAM